MKRFTLLFLIAMALSPSLSFAGAGYIITESGTPSKWPDAANGITMNPEDGACGSFTNAQMLTKLENNLANWSSQTDVDLSFTITAGSLGGVDACNYGDYLVGVTGSNDTVSVADGYNPVLFDNDGEIVAAVAGSSNKYRVLGFANPSGFTSDYSQIVDGQAVFNCVCLDGNINGTCTSGGQTVTFSEDELNFTMVHELGHFMNLDHTQINCTGDGSDNLCDDSDTTNDDNIPTMFPISENAAQQLTPIDDDIHALATIYPASGFAAAHCKVTGSLLDAAGKQLRCADVQATLSPVTNDKSHSVAFVSGAYAPAVDNNADGDTVDSGECASGCGDFQLYLEPGNAYVITVQPINSSFTGGSGISPCANSQISTISTESIDSITAAQCTAGATIALGNKTATLSTGGVTPSGSESAIPDLETDMEIVHALPPAAIGGGYDVATQLDTSTSCPESDGSTSGSGTTTGGGGGSRSSASTGSCNLDTTAASGNFAAALIFCVAIGNLIFLGVRRRG